MGHPAVAWVAVTPLLIAIARVSNRLPPGGSAPASRLLPARLAFLSAGGFPHRRAFILGFVAGCVCFAGTLYWLTEVMVTFGGISRPVGVILNALLVGFLALFPAAFAAAASVLVARLGYRGLLLAPAVWVTTELGRRYVYSGFPWVLLGYSQTEVLAVAQLASVVGVYGLSGLVATVSAALACALLGRSRRDALVAVASVLLVAGVAAWGARRVARGELARGGDVVRVGLVQGNIAQEDKWNPALAGRILQRYLTMTREAAAQGARLIMWPESATPFMFEEDRAGAAAIRQVARETGAFLLIGSDEMERGEPLRFYNSAFLVRPDGTTADVYRKIHLVPFGEYVPFRTVLFFASPLVESVSDFSPGQSIVTLPVDGRRASTAICYEVVYPDLIRQFVLAGSELLTTITNDAWYGRSSAPHQHFQQAAMRAIEQGRYLARAANTGISGIVDPYGRVLARTPIFEPQVLVGDVRYLTGRTIYGMIGDLYAYGCAALTLAALLAARRARARPRPS
jgi:apolipoprotein N-acyltransferase